MGVFGETIKNAWLPVCMRNFVTTKKRITDILEVVVRRVKQNCVRVTCTRVAMKQKFCSAASHLEKGENGVARSSVSGVVGLGRC